MTGTISGQSESKQVWVQQKAATETYAYDDDGNLTSDGLWNYEWDAENRLKSMQTNATALGWGAPNRQLAFTYDYLGRRIGKSVTENSVTKSTRYVYRGWQVIAEVNPATWQVTRSYAWGLDLRSSLEDSGGTGAMVLETVHAAASLTAYSVAYDGAGHVSALVSRADGQAGAVYEYDSFGQQVQKRGPIADDNPIRYATKYHDPETGLVYYGLRYYDSSLGRFINRDPIEEAGGDNLYAFLGNNPVGRNEYLGLHPDADELRGYFSRVLELRIDGTLMGYVDNSAFLDFVMLGRELEGSRSPFGIGTVSFGTMTTDRGHEVAHVVNPDGWDSWRGFGGGMRNLWGDTKKLAHPVELARELRDASKWAWDHKKEAALGAWHSLKATAAELKTPYGRGEILYANAAAMALPTTWLSRFSKFIKRIRGVSAAESGAKPFAMGLTDEGLEAFAKARGATTWKQLPDPANWRPGVLEKLADPKTPVHFNLDGVDVWKGVQRGASGGGGPTDWELLQIQQNPQFWDSLQFWKGGQPAPNPFK